MSNLKKLIMLANQAADERPSIPEGYVELEYLESVTASGKGQCFLSTGIKEKNVIVDCICQGNPNVSNSYTSPFGECADYAGSTVFYYKDKGWGVNASKLFPRGGINDIVEIYAELTSSGNIPSIRASIDNVIDGVHNDVLDATRTSAVTYYDLTIFGPRAGSLNYLFAGKIWRLKVRDFSGNVLGLFYPFLRAADNKPGMYDFVSGQFLTNKGSGEFRYKLKE